MSTASSGWAELLSVALLGTERRVDTDPAALLDRAAALAVKARAGRRPGRVGLPATAPAEQRPLIGWAAAQRLERMLDGDHQRHLGAWLSVAAARGWRVRPEVLPALLDRGARDRSLRAAIATVAGQRGIWLAGLEPTWAYVLDETAADSPDPEVWELGREGERRAYLARIREVDPAHARELLTEVWKAEGASARTTLISALATGLAIDDEPFLEAALDDRSEKVRRVAADLLLRVPGSAYSERMKARTLPVLRFDGQRVRVEAPVSLEAEAERDGIGGRPLRGQSERQHWVWQMVARVDPAVWVGRFGRTAAEIAAAPIDQEWEWVLRDGWTRATALFERADWARALLEFDPMVGVVLPTQELQDHAARRVTDGPVDDAIGSFLTHVPGPWTGALAAAIVGLLRTADPQRPQIVQITDLATDRLDPALHDRFDPESRPVMDLFFRHHLLKELQ